MYEAAGVTPDKEIIAHCQLGVRAAHTWFVLKHVLGYPQREELRRLLGRNGATATTSRSRSSQIRSWGVAYLSC